MRVYLFTVNGRLGYFQFWAIWNEKDVAIHLQFLCRQLAYISCDKGQGSGFHDLSEPGKLSQSGHCVILCAQSSSFSSTVAALGTAWALPLPQQTDD